MCAEGYFGQFCNSTNPDSSESNGDLPGLVHQDPDLDDSPYITTRMPEDFENFTISTSSGPSTSTMTTTTLTTYVI